MSEPTPSPDQSTKGSQTLAGFGPNEWLVDELYQQYLADKSSVDEAWWEFFADYQPSDPARVLGTTNGARTPAAPAAPVPAAPAPAASFRPHGARGASERMAAPDCCRPPACLLPLREKVARSAG